jgi:hypothetical protein
MVKMVAMTVNVGGFCVAAPWTPLGFPLDMPPVIFMPFLSHLPFAELS